MAKSWKGVMAVVGGVTAVLTLLFALLRLAGSLTGWHQGRQKTDELVAEAQEQRASKHYPEAWATLQDAAQLAPNNERIRVAQEDLAMAWLRDAHAQGDQTFTTIVQPLLPVIERGIVHAQGTRKADLLAHAGWADFLRWKDDRRERAIEANYQRAVQLDPNNPFAQAMWGHWILTTTSDLPSARQHFDAALRSGREHEFVRSLQIAALHDSSAQQSEDELLQVANQMRQRAERASDGERTDVLWATCFSNATNWSSWTRSPTRLNPTDEIATLQWLSSSTTWDEYHKDLLTFCEARARAWAGDRARALALLQSLERSGGGDATRHYAQLFAGRLRSRS